MLEHVRRSAVSFLFFCLATSLVLAQELQPVPPGPLTLEQVLQLAEERSEAVGIARTGVQRAEGEQVRARSGRFPQLNASAGYDRALASEFSGLFEGGFGGGEGEEIDLPFGRQNTWRVNLVFSQSVYSGGRLGAQGDIAAAGRAGAELGLTSARARLLFDATQAFYDAALSESLVRIAEATVAQAEATVRQLQAGFEAGAQPEFELLRARVSRDTQRPIVIRQRANREIALLRLKKLLDLPPDYDLQIVAALDGAVAPPPVFAERLQAVEAQAASIEAAVSRTPVKEAASVVRLREASLRAALAERRPAISVTSNYSNVAYPSGLFPTGDYRTNWTVGASLNVPILTGGRQRGSEAVARADLDQSRLQLRLVEELALLDARAAQAELTAAAAVLEASAGTIEQATRAYQIAEVRFQSGVSTQLELADARLQLQLAEASRAQAARDLQVARARVALLPDLPLGVSSGITAIAPPQAGGRGGNQ